MSAEYKHRHIYFYRVWEQLKRRSSFQVLPTMDNQRKTNGATRELTHPAFQNIRVCLVSISIKLMRTNRG